MLIEPLTEQLSDEWNEFVGSNPNGTVYHLWQWQKFIAEVFNFRCKSVVLTDSARIVGGCPIFEVPRIIGTEFTTSPFRDRGGALWSDSIDPGPLFAHAIEYASSRRNKVTFRQFSQLPADIIESHGLIERQGWTTTRIDLTPGAEAIHKALKETALGPVRKAETASVTVHIDLPGDDLVFSHLFDATRHRLGIPTFPASFFQLMLKHLKLNSNAKLLIARLDNRPIAGILLLMHGDCVIDGYAASLADGRSYGANDLLVWHAIMWSHENGYSYFDFGADSPRQKGLLSFKKKWGGLHHQVFDYVWSNIKKAPRDLDSSDPQHQFARKILGRLPMPLFRLSSRLLTRRLS